MMTKRASRKPLALLLAAALASAAPAALAAEDAFHIAQADQIEWQAGPDSLPAGAQMKVLAGDPGKQGPFVVRFRFPAHFKVAMHTHPMVENLTMISGEMMHDLGNDDADAQAVAPGGFIYLPSNTPHSVWTTDRPAVVQLTAIGPFKIEYLDPKDDPRNAR
ncbi:cupin domain-containing protein [Salinisphaera aquimarina]|uniref:Cupin domain-containing protein n=1 Tax=Salinisphaera aquimarina TaxID=2094031 RepID=A0ABV7EK86_9GAMM